MGKFATFKNLLFHNPLAIVVYLAERVRVRVPDSIYLRFLFRYNMGRRLHLRKPKTYNEKLQWLKLFDRNPENTMLVDKYGVKSYVSNLIGSDHVIPTLGVWERTEDIDFGKLPESFVLKCTHDSGSTIVCRDKESFNKELAIERLSASICHDFYEDYREWPYKNVRHRVIAEPYMADENSGDLIDYKFFCFDGEPKLLFMASDRQNENEETKFDFFDMEFNHLDIINGHPNSERKIAKPKAFDEMKDIATRLSKGKPHVRIDLYDINGTVYFGEFTFFHWSGLKPFEPEIWDMILGEWIKLPSKTHDAN